MKDEYRQAFAGCQMAKGIRRLLRFIGLGITSHAVES